MSVPRPGFMDSPYFVMEADNWHLKPGAPKEVVEEFTEYMDRYNANADEGVFL